MKLSEKQAIFLLDVVKWSINVYGVAGGYGQDQRRLMVDEIMNQQSDVLVERDWETET